VPVWGWAGAAGVGLTISAAWWATFAISRASFDPHPVQALSFTGPSSELLTRVLFVTDKPPTFDLGLVPGVFIGSFIAAALFRELKLEGFQGGASMRRYLLGAMAMGFGGMLAGGCAVGAVGVVVCHVGRRRTHRSHRGPTPGGQARPGHARPFGKPGRRLKSTHARMEIA
jgi:hypothetical protein